MDYTSAKAGYDRDGFVIVRQFLPPAELAELTQQLDHYIAEVVPTLPPEAAFYQDRARPETLKQMQFMDRDPWFQAYMQNPRWLKLASTLVGERAECQGPEWFNKPPGVEHPTPPHQDNYYFNLTPPNVITLWMALDVVDDENGCLRYVKGSHTQGFRPHGRSKVLGFSQAISDYGPADTALEVPIHLQPGDVVAHHGMTIHRAEPNRSTTRHRRSFAMVLRGESCQRDETRFDNYMAQVKSQHSELGLSRAEATAQ